MVANASGVIGDDWEEEEEEEEEVFSSSSKQVMHFTNTLEHALIFVKGMVNEHV